MTIGYVDEAAGIAMAAVAANVPCVVSFTVETDGRLPDGIPLGDAIEATDAATGGSPLHYMINCAHPTHFRDVLDPATPWTRRIGGIRANASTLSHAELDEMTKGETVGMYTPKAFELDEASARAVIDEVGVASLVTMSDGGFDATVVPLLLDGDRLIGHVAKANPIWRNAGNALAIVNGPEGYVSPSWYPSKAEHGKVVPTWNYVSVHVHATLAARHTPAWKRDVVTRLTDRHEQRIGSTWQVTDAPADFIDRMLDAIVGIELSIDRIEGKAKLSQNRPDADIAGVVAANPNPMGVAVANT